jgi:hypothetical protein
MTLMTTAVRLVNGVGFIAKFDGEFADPAQTYVGTGRAAR